MNHEPIAYTYEADTHCPECTKARFGISDHGFIAEGATDNEGNPVGAIFDWDGQESIYCGTCYEPIRETELDRAIREPDERHGDSKLVGILRALSNDTSNYEEETGDVSEFGKWAALFVFNDGERARLESVCGFPVEQKVALVIDNGGFASAEDEEAFRHLDAEYGAQLVCAVCGESKEAQQSFCGGEYCENVAQFSNPHEHDADALAQRATCEGCAHKANEEAQLSPGSNQVLFAVFFDDDRAPLRNVPEDQLPSADSDFAYTVRETDLIE